MVAMVLVNKAENLVIVFKVSMTLCFEPWHNHFLYEPELNSGGLVYGTKQAIPSVSSLEHLHQFLVHRRNYRIPMGRFKTTTTVRLDELR